jgi:hypothetical protein
MKERRVYYVTCQICGYTYKYLSDDPKKVTQRRKKTRRCPGGFHPFAVSLFDDSIISYSRPVASIEVDNNIQEL